MKLDGEDDLQFADIDAQLRAYDESLDSSSDEPRRSVPTNKFRIQGLEEVTEQENESDVSSQISCGSFASSSS